MADQTGDAVQECLVDVCLVTPGKVERASRRIRERLHAFDVGLGEHVLAAARGQHERELLPTQHVCELPGDGAPLIGERDVGSPGVLAVP